jgi:CheY-like chemotaxis protein
VAEVSEEPIDIPALPHGNGTLLVVEDEEAIRRVIVQTLSECGYTVLDAGSPREAIPIGEHYDGRIDLLITDLVMPDMNGVKMAEIIRRARPDMPVIYISGYPERVLAHGRLNDDDTSLMLKPFSPQTIAEHVSKVLGDRND